ncbi:MAG: hypothetical protein ACLP5H_02855 [Desulfomonilaceae bacterium]
MTPQNFPFVLSPNLGCPHLWSVEELGKPDDGMALIVADQPGSRSPLLKESLRDKLSLGPSCRNGLSIESIPLEIISDPIEIRDWDTLSAFPDLDDTRKLINKVLHYQVLGSDTRYWMVRVKPNLDGQEPKTLLGVCRTGN